MHCTLLLLTGCLSLTLLSSRCTETLLARRAHTSLTASHVSAGTLICCPTHDILQCHGGLQKKLIDRIFKNVLNCSHSFSCTKKRQPPELGFTVKVVLKSFLNYLIIKCTIFISFTEVPQRSICPGLCTSLIQIQCLLPSRISKCQHFIPHQTPNQFHFSNG